MASVVIKVQHGNTLRRFTTYINENEPVLDNAMLRDKIRSLFTLDSNDFVMTYIDEDGDAITIVDDNDVRDAVCQSVSPLRISVESNNGNNGNGNSNSNAGGSSRAAELINQALNTGVSELLRSVNEPLPKALESVPVELANKASKKASSSASALARVFEKIKPARLINAESLTFKDSKAPVSTTETGSSCMKKKNNQKRTEGVIFRDVQPPSKLVDLNVNTESSIVKQSQAPVSSTEASLKNTEKTRGVKLRYELFQTLLDGKKVLAQGSSNKTIADFVKEKEEVGSGSLKTDSDSHGDHRHSRGNHRKRHGLDNYGIGTIFHGEVQCNGCGVSLVPGSCYRKDDYDLCSVCFGGVGTASDYVRIDRSVHGFMQDVPFKGSYEHSLRLATPRIRHLLRVPGSKLPRSKLDSRFVCDISIIDGTVMAPFTSFTKIWRMRNNGSIIWPQGSQLKWFDGHQISNTLSVDIEIPADGLPVDSEIEIALSCTAPEHPGLYSSYWRMTAPGGQKFGQRVWVLIQVDASITD